MLYLAATESNCVTCVTTFFDIPAFFVVMMLDAVKLVSTITEFDGSETLKVGGNDRRGFI